MKGWEECGENDKRQEIRDILKTKSSGTHQELSGLNHA